MEKNIKEIAALWKQEKRQYVKQSTFATYTIALENHLIPYFGDDTNITEEKVQSFVLNKLHAGLSQKTVKDMLIVLKMIVKFGTKKGWMNYNCWDIKYPSESKLSRIEVLSISNQKLIMNYVTSHFTFQNLGIYICLCTGMRIGEICALTWADIDLDNRTIHVNKTIERIYIIDNERKYTKLIIDSPKTSSSIREIPMSSGLLKIMRPLKKIVNDHFYLLTNAERPTEPRTYRNYYLRLMEMLNLPKMKFHGLRHTFATRCIESKCDYKTVSVLLGHANISTTLNLYVHPNIEQKQRCIEQMFKAFK